MSYGIRLNGVSFEYEGGRRLIQGVDLSVEPGEVVAVTSSVGGGKTTLLKIAAGLIEPDEGSVMIDGRDFWSLPDGERYRIRSRMGFDFQEGALIANMTVFENLALPLWYHGEVGEAEVAREVGRWMDRTGLSQYADQLPAALSTGLKRRVSFARAMLVGRDFFFWDETQTSLLTDAVLEKKRLGVGSIVATKEVETMKGVADRIIKTNLLHYEKFFS